MAGDRGMSPVECVLGGAGAVVLGSVLASLVLDRSVFETVVGCLFGWLVLPAFWVATLLVWCGAELQSLSPRALERFARTKRVGGGQAFMLSYGRRGVIWVRGLRDNERVSDG